MKKLQDAFKSSHVLPVMLVIGLLVFGVGCQSNKGEKQPSEIPFKNNSTVYTQWDEVFQQDTIIPLEFADPAAVIYTIGDIVILGDGGYLIMDGKGRRMIQFNASSKFVRQISKKGSGPGELALGVGRGFIDRANNLYLFDIITRRINKYLFPDYSFEKIFIMPHASQKTILDKMDNFILYTVSDPAVLIKVDQKGTILKKGFQVNDANFRLFSSRFQLGKLAEVPGEGFIFSYPQEYKIYYYDYDFNLKKQFYPATHSRFFPEKAVLPASLSPYDYTPEHARWWGSALRTSRTFYMDNEIFIQELIEFVNMSEKSFINIHDLSGNTYAVGIEPPFQDAGFILQAEKGYIYVVEDSVLDEKGNTTPTRLHRYKLKNFIGPQKKR